MPDYVLPSFAQVRDGVQRFVGNTQTPPPPETFNDDETADPGVIDPVTEGRGQYAPYRGVEQHGVPFGSVNDVGPQGYNDRTIPVAYDDPKPPSHIVDVRVVHDDVEEIRAFRAGQTSVATVAQIVSRNRQRTGLKLKHIGTAEAATNVRVWIGQDANVNAMTGYPLDAGGELAINSTEAVYAVSSTGVAVPLAIWMDFVQDV